MTYPNTVISMPSNLFTLNDKFKACTNGSVYVGQVDTDPTVIANQIQAYIEQENGTLVPVDQPIKINAAGILVDSNGQVQKFVLTNAEYSMTVLNASDVQEFYFHKIYDQGIAAALEVEERLLQPGANLYRGSNGSYIQDGDVIPAGTTHVSVMTNGKVENVALSPVASGTVSNLYDFTATIGGTDVDFVAQITSFATLADALNATLVPYQAITITRYANGLAPIESPPKGGGDFVYIPTYPKTSHNGGTVISTTVPFDGSVSSIPAFLDGTGETSEGEGCLVRINELGYETPEMYGAQRDESTDDIYSISKCDATCPSRYIKYTSGVYAIGAHPDHPEGFSPSRDRTTHEGVGFSWTGDTGHTILKYIGPVNDVFAVLKLSRIDIGSDSGASRNYIARNFKLDGNALAGFGLYENYANNDSLAENIVVINTRYRAFHVVKSWYNNMRNIVAYNNYGAGIAIATQLTDLIPESTEIRDCNGLDIINPRAHSNGRQLPDETTEEWEARRFNESENRIANWGMAVGQIHGINIINPVLEYNYGPGYYRTNAGGSDARGTTITGGYVERNCNQAILDGVATDFWEVWHDSDDSGVRCETVTGLWFNASMGSSRGRVKITGTPKSSNNNKLIEFKNCPNISIPSPSHQQFGNNSEVGGSSMSNPHTAVFQDQGLADTAVTLRDARDGTGLEFGTIRYDTSSSFDSSKAIEFLPRASVSNVSLRTSMSTTSHGADNTGSSGTPSLRWTEVCAVNGAINTSDRREKTDFTAMPPEFIDVLIALIDNIQLWKWISAVGEKGDEARYHVGPIAQDVYDAFEAAGFDAFDYGFVGKDALVELVQVGTERVQDGDEEYEKPIYEEVPVLDEDGNQRERWNLRPGELSYAMIWAQQQQIKQLLASS
nr:phage tailspike protein [uncultured Vibrio sp.]